MKTFTEILDLDNDANFGITWETIENYVGQCEIKN